MPNFSAESMDRLETCDKRIKTLCYRLIKYVDFTVICGFRSLDEQQKLYDSGATKVTSGKHNAYPSKAIDIAPYPIKWGDTRRFCVFAGKFLLLAQLYGTAIRWGGDWDMDTFTTDQQFNDLVHFELL